MNRYINLVNYFGGKYPHLKWLIDKFPQGNYHFIDIMCGSANVALNVDYPFVTINDINDDVFNLFKVLRENYEEFLRALYLTPFCRTELYKIIDDKRAGKSYSDIEEARRYFVKCQMGYGANGSQNNHYGMGFEYLLHSKGYQKVDNWNVKLKRLSKIVSKLRGFQIEHSNALDLFPKVNRPGNIVYFDPPYLLSVRHDKKRYKHDLSDDFHHQLAEKATSAECYIAISGYDSHLYNELFKGFYKSINKPTKTNTGKRVNQECLWTNYDPSTINNNQLKINLNA